MGLLQHGTVMTTGTVPASHLAHSIGDHVLGRRHADLPGPDIDDSDLGAIRLTIEKRSGDHVDPTEKFWVDPRLWSTACKAGRRFGEITVGQATQSAPMNRPVRDLAVA